ncbi:hypothetical protein F2Q69_00040327 [Brassica cretica]|uniref:DUF1985 domain-containing protein n=1 Tax=Brassica cretica TaxID=69181 RepID=A0A8S9NAR6_BRACR|nr:hypothetical protein F2Q69_00040327 [Brassica cretica]
MRLLRQVKKPYLWMLSKGDKYTVRSLYDLLKKKARTMTRLERLSIRIAIITEEVIIAEKSRYLIPKGRLLAYKNYDSLSKLAWGKVAYKVLSKSVKRLSAMPMLGKTLGKPCQETSSADPLCLHWDSTRAPTITEVLEVEKKNNEQTQDEEQQVEADAEFGDGDKERETSKINEGQTLEEEEEEQMEADTEVEESVQEQEHKKNEEKRKDEGYEKAKEKFQDEDGSKLDKLIQMLYDLNKRVEIIENVLEVADSYESPCNYDDTKGAPNDETEEEENSGGKKKATDDENDDEEISDTQQLTEVNILGENENTEKSLQTKTLEKVKKKDA